MQNEVLENSAKGNIPGYRLMEGIGHRTYGTATNLHDHQMRFKATTKAMIIFL